MRTPGLALVGGGSPVASFDYESDHKAIESFLEKIQVDNNTFGQVKAAAGLASRDPVADLVGGNGDPIVSDDLKAEALADHLQGGFSSAAVPVVDSFSSSVLRAVEGIDDRTPLETFSGSFAADGSSIDDSARWDAAGFVRPEHIGSAIARRRAKKSSGLDRIPDTALKLAGNQIDDIVVMAATITHIPTASVTTTTTKTIPTTTTGSEAEFTSAAGALSSSSSSSSSSSVASSAPRTGGTSTSASLLSLSTLALPQSFPALWETSTANSTTKLLNLSANTADAITS
ncbi:uncharacterized protein LOC133335827, partial [Musca vetustissima]|uniref:uncharacterized protein LOC133335827 n=1 Tax=Musca vetustissima TaxID=27455 RepID=UPI002AB7CFA7